MEEIIRLAMQYIPDIEARKGFYKAAIRTFEGHDWDTQYDAMNVDPVFDEVMRAINPELFEEID
jgi:hypothetical protein